MKSGVHFNPKYGNKVRFFTVKHQKEVHFLCFTQITQIFTHFTQITQKTLKYSLKVCR